MGCFAPDTSHQFENRYSRDNFCLAIQRFVPNSEIVSGEASQYGYLDL
ncbi:MAG: hypothetical protein F6J93_16355 [Oscillatoria sp. SIO1A7]|nr:hypothetical protein [Oscillatoria sp. SIO1A7]